KSTDVVSIIDDVLTTGKSVAEMLGILEPTGTKISTCAVVVARRGARLDVPLVSLLTEEDLVAA
ncbi:hypothetical protein HY478_00425, partial [Candidatus Uhrbacteria bacterium]|nr:hypothetical protein [Candidatus Uhrbacteria bacterium]